MEELATLVLQSAQGCGETSTGGQFFLGPFWGNEWSKRVVKVRAHSDQDRTEASLQPRRRPRVARRTGMGEEYSVVDGLVADCWLRSGEISETGLTAGGRKGATRDRSCCVCRCTKRVKEAQAAATRQGRWRSGKNRKAHRSQARSCLQQVPRTSTV